MISIIIPTYNEADNVSTLINQIERALKKHSFEIIIVDDNSPDKTWRIVKKLTKTKKHLKLIHRTNQKGLTSAFNAGIKKSQGSIIGWLDADLSHPPKLLSSMINKLKNNDVVIASRYVKKAKDNRRMFWAVLFSFLINKLAKTLLYKEVTDYTSGYILLKKKFLTKPLKGDYGEYFINLVFNLKKTKTKIIEIPYISINRVRGQSKTATNLLGFIKRGSKYLYTILNLCLKKY